MTVSPVEPPPESFNFAGHLLSINSGRASKLAFVDDRRRADLWRARRSRAPLRRSSEGRGVRREERVMILMLDCLDWPVAFLGAMLAGILPVAVNTLLTADDLAYMLEHSRAQAAIVSGAVKPALKAALAKSDHEVHKIVVSRPTQPLEFERDRVRGLSSAPARRSTRPARTHADDPAFWLYSSGSTGRPKGTVHSHANPYWTTELYGKAILGLRERTSASPPRSSSSPMASATRSPSRLASARRCCSWPSGRLRRRFSGACAAGSATSCRPPSMARRPASPACSLPLLPKREEVALSLVSSAGEALPAEIGERFKRHFGVDIVDGIGSTEMLHIFISNRPDKVRYGSTGWPVPGYDIELRAEDGRRHPGRRAGRPVYPRALGGSDVLGQPRPGRARPSRAVDAEAATNTSATPTEASPTPAAPTTC